MTIDGDVPAERRTGLVAIGFDACSGLIIPDDVLPGPCHIRWGRTERLITCKATMSA